MQLTQIYISHGRQPMGKALEFNAKLARESLPGFEYVLYGDEAIQDFLASGFDREVLDAYRKLAPYAYKSDFARYCILHELGGWYLGVGLRLAGLRISLPDGIRLLAFGDQPYRHTSSSYDCANGAIYAAPKHPATAKAIELVLENVKSQY